jgi:hypothetical protein
MRTPVAVELHFEPADDLYLKACFKPKDLGDEEIIFGTMLGKVCQDCPELYKHFQSLMTECAVYVINETYGPGTNAEAICVDKPKEKLS